MSGDVITPSEPIYPCYEDYNDDDDDELPEVKRINFNHFGNSDFKNLIEGNCYLTLRLDCVSNMQTIGEVHRFLTSVFSIKVPCQIPRVDTFFDIHVISIGGTENSALMEWSYANMYSSIFNDKHEDQTEFINAMRVFCEHLLPTEPGTDWAEEVKEFYTKRYYDGKEKYPLYGN